MKIKHSPQDRSIFEAIYRIRKEIPDFKPKLGIILGSGAGHIADQIQDAKTISYLEIPGMRECKVEGHHGLLHLGSIKNVPVACFQGRNHVYEGHSSNIIQAPIRILKLLGAETVLLISAVGTLSAEIEVGSLVCIRDHINLLFSNPLVGPNDPFWGPRFPDMENAYDPELRHCLAETAKQEHIDLSEGVYVGVLGPSFETPAEIRAFRILGADVVGMSTVPEVITARHCGLKVVTLAIATNKAAGLSKEGLDHKISLSIAERSAVELSRLVVKFIDKAFKQALF